MKKSYLWCGLSFIGIGCVLIGATIIFSLIISLL